MAADAQAETTRDLVSVLRAEIADLETWLERQQEMTRDRIDRRAGDWTWRLAGRTPISTDLTRRR